MKIVEEGSALDQLLAATTNPEEAIPPDYVVDPAVLTPTVDYDERKDPEMQPRRNESKSEIRRNRLMQESKTSDEIAFINSGADDLTYEAFMQSPFANANITEQGYYRDFRFFVENARVKIEPSRVPAKARPKSMRVASTGQAGGPSSLAAAAPKSAFKRPELAADYQISDRLARLQKSTQNVAIDREQDPTADQMFREMVGVVEDICSGTATKRHALIYGDPGVGKTYECTRAAQRSLDKEKYKYKYYKGNVGKSMTDCAAFFYKYHDMYVIMLDDNDAMIMKGAGQQVNLFFKAILSPEARETPIKIPSTIQSKATDALEQLADSKQIRFRIDREALRENTFRLYQNGELLGEQFIPSDDAVALYESTYDPRDYSQVNRRKQMALLDETWKLREADQAGDDDYDPNGEDLADTEASMPVEFTFNSSVIFISNLVKEQIDPAVWDRMTHVKIALNPMQYMKRLGDILANLGQVDAAISSTPQELQDWSKMCVYGILQGIVEQWMTSTPLFQEQTIVEIPRRTLTFRLFDDFIETFLRNAKVYAQEHHLNITSKSDRDTISVAIENEIAVSMVRQIMYGE